MSYLEKALDKIIAERIRQDRKWGVQDHDDLMWYAILGEEFGEIGKAIFEASLSGIDPLLDPNVEEEIIQTAAVAVAWLENRWRRQLQLPT